MKKEFNFVLAILTLFIATSAHCQNNNVPLSLFAGFAKEANYSMSDAQIMNLYNAEMNTHFKTPSEIIADNIKKVGLFYNNLKNCKPGLFSYLSAPLPGYYNRDTIFYFASIKGMINDSCAVDIENFEWGYTCQIPKQSLGKFTSNLAALAGKGDVPVAILPETQCPKEPGPMTNIANDSDRQATIELAFQTDRSLIMHNVNATGSNAANALNSKILNVDAVKFYNNYFHTHYKNIQDIDTENSAKVKSYFSDLITCKPGNYDVMQIYLGFMSEVYNLAIVHLSILGNRSSGCWVKVSPDYSKESYECIIPDVDRQLYKRLNLSDLSLTSTITSAPELYWVPETPNIHCGHIAQ